MDKPSFTSQGDNKSLLDALEDLPLKGFQEIDATPSTGITSLPTPKAGPPHLNLTEVVEPSSQLPQLTDSMLYVKFPEPPGAPLIKDLDSFTEGTGKGSFDSIPAASTDQYGGPLPQINILSLSLLPPHNTSMSIELWREEVYLYSPTAPQPFPSEEHPFDARPSSSPPNKRPRSLASDDEVRRIRRRSHSDVCQQVVIYMERKRSLPSIGTAYDSGQHQRFHSVPHPAPD
ncbi:hypothetical protein E1B28_005660 [Marasmius oreades]|uniref:Uncharacterized protein n=1 Tax=Marasmius oreades TaxID=181124 RepID=A0A9P7S4C3_9AGAR|nr:uncharacterized protein E1B28_005660 [Marasmius oreades]KAG7094852.1 hypothetical protein E1B28_005660 [Marasmius oreades]